MKHRPHKAHKFEGTPNPALDPVKEFVRRRGWSPAAFLLPSAAPPPSPPPAVRVFALWHDTRRFIVRAKDQPAAEQILQHHLT